VLLRASGQATGEAYDLTAIHGDGSDGGGVPAGVELIAFADALLGSDAAALDKARAVLRAVVGDAGLVDAVGVAATFNAIDRIADATGIPLEEAKAAVSAGFRTDLGIDSYAAGRQ
jgi:alkylhydroperoxidase family enzyme